MTKRFHSFLAGRAALVVLAAMLGACGPVAVMATDAGTDAPLGTDAPRPPPVPYSCEGEMTHIDGVLGETASATLDTTMTAERPRDLGACGNSSTTAGWARQAIIEYVVPGSGLVAVRFDTRFPETTPGFNTLVQVRTACRTIPTQTFPTRCFDDSASSEPRASGAVTVMGGDVLFLVVTGYSDPPAAEMQLDEGTVRIDVTPTVNTAPTVESGVVVLVDRPPVSGRDNDPAIVDLTATDAEGTIIGYALALFTARGQVDFNGDGVADASDVLVFGFDSITGAGPYMGRAEITPLEDGYQLAAFCRTQGCTGASLIAIDQGYLPSAPLRVSVLEGTIVGGGIGCDATNICITGYACIGGFCARP